MEEKNVAPVMDVAPPKPQPQLQPKPHEAEVHEAPPSERTGEEPKPPETPDKKPDKAKAKKPAKPEKTSRNNGVGMAIAATVIIVLGLAAMATYAYLKSR